MNLISIIIPVYNAEKYLNRCLDSILNQDFQNFEVICINDGSTDSSEQICREYSSRDERFTVISTENSGVSKARNTGLSKMSGDWYSFVDADDWLEPNYLSLLLDNALKNNCSLSACSHSSDYETVYNKSKQNQLLCLHSSQECIHNFICSGLSMQGMIWNKLYQTASYGNIRFREDISINEDCLYTFEVTRKCSSACMSDAILYHWFQRNDSACHSRRNNADFTNADVFKYLIAQTKKLNDPEIKMTLVYDYILEVTGVLLSADYKTNDPEIKKRRRECKKYRKLIWNRFGFKLKCRFIISVYIPIIRKFF